MRNHVGPFVPRTCPAPPVSTEDRRATALQRGGELPPVLLTPLSQPQGFEVPGRLARRRLPAGSPSPSQLAMVVSATSHVGTGAFSARSLTVRGGLPPRRSFRKFSLRFRN